MILSRSYLILLSEAGIGGNVKRWEALARKLARSAESDFRLAKSYIGNTAAASLLYEQAIKKALRALFIKRNRAEPPEKAGIAYLAEKSMVPNYIAEELIGDAGEVPEPLEEIYEISKEEVKQQNALYRRDAAKRLLDYAVTVIG